MQTLKAESMSNETLICKEPVLDIHAILTGSKKKSKRQTIDSKWEKMVCLRYVFHKNVVDLV